MKVGSTGPPEGGHYNRRDQKSNWALILNRRADVTDTGEIVRSVVLQVDVNRVGVRHVEDIERHHRSGVVVPEDFPESQIDTVEAIAVFRPGLDEVEELNGLAARERPSEVRLRHHPGIWTASASALRLWAEMLGKLAPAKGTLWKVPLTSTSIFGTM